MKSFTHLCLISLLSLSVSGCIIVDRGHDDGDSWSADQRSNRETISQLELDMQRVDVIRRMGTPTDSEAFSHDGEELRVLFYRTQRKHSDGETTRDETTPLVFKNDRLIGWGEKVYSELRY